MTIIFWSTLTVLFFTYFGYPLCVLIIGLLSKKHKIDETYRPSVSIIIPVYNEEKVIERKIKNTLLLDYPIGKLEIRIASDGSTDGTKTIVSRYLNHGIKFFDYERGGKIATLNKIVPNAKGEILVLTDANVMLTNDAVLKLVRHFCDSSIGVVSGVETISQKRDYISSSERKYWNYEILIKEAESKIHSTVGACGPLYAIRKEMFPQIPTNVNLCDDMTIPLNAVRQGKRIIVDREVIALEHVSLTIKDEWRRKVRIATQVWQSLRYDKKLLIPFASPIAFQLIIHKVLRWLTLLLLVILFLSNAFIRGGFYTAILLLQTIFYSFSIIGFVLIWHNTAISSVLAFLSYFFMTQCAQMVGLYNSLFKKGKPIWQPIQRVD